LVSRGSDCLFNQYSGEAILEMGTRTLDSLLGLQERKHNAVKWACCGGSESGI